MVVSAVNTINCMVYMETTEISSIIDGVQHVTVCEIAYFMESLSAPFPVCYEIGNDWLYHYHIVPSAKHGLLV